MMKKLMVLMLVFGLAATANAFVAGSMSIRVATNPSATYVPTEWTDPGTGPVTLYPSDNLWIGVYNNTLGVPGKTQQGLIDLGIGHSPPGGVPADTKWTGSWKMYVPPLVSNCPANEYAGVSDYNGDGSLYVDVWYLTLTNGQPDAFNGIGVLDTKQLHCEYGPSIDTIYMFDGGTGNILDTMTINQVPEPMTITLLGLGGLFLRRCKKQQTA
jgi:hypothetical protein